MGRIAILGGTGPEGMGLALRFAMCGEDVVIGSRQTPRAVDAAARASAQLSAAGYAATLAGAENQTAITGADMVVIATPFAGIAELLPPMAAALDGTLVVDVVN